MVFCPKALLHIIAVTEEVNQHGSRGSSDVGGDGGASEGGEEGMVEGGSVVDEEVVVCAFGVHE